MGLDIERYLAGSDYVEIKTGQSGAAVYDLDGKKILKHVVRKKLKAGLFDTYCREALFYQCKMQEGASYLPEILDLEISEDEILILMKKYKQPERGYVSEELLRKIAGALACVHTDSKPEFLCKDVEQAKLMPEERVRYCLNGWRNVLAEHPNAFSEEPLDQIAAAINDVIKWHDSERKVLIHGDFHWDNLLENDGCILICDWQGVGIGGASGDVSFFLSRLGADGITIDEKRFLELYSDEVKARTGITADVDEIARHMAAANVITSFSFWHEFLHGNEETRVRDIYDKMVQDFEGNRV